MVDKGRLFAGGGGSGQSLDAQAGMSPATCMLTLMVLSGTGDGRGKRISICTLALVPCRQAWVLHAAVGSTGPIFLPSCPSHDCQASSTIIREGDSAQS